MIGRAVPILLTLVGCLAIWFAYDEIRFLRGTFFWEIRYITLAVFAFALLSVLELIRSQISRLL